MLTAIGAIAATVMARAIVVQLCKQRAFPILATCLPRLRGKIFRTSSY